MTAIEVGLLNLSKTKWCFNDAHMLTYHENETFPFVRNHLENEAKTRGLICYKEMKPKKRSHSLQFLSSDDLRLFPAAKWKTEIGDDILLYDCNPILAIFSFTFLLFVEFFRLLF